VAVLGVEGDRKSEGIGIWRTFVNNEKTQGWINQEPSQMKQKPKQIQPYTIRRKAAKEGTRRALLDGLKHQDPRSSW